MQNYCSFDILQYTNFHQIHEPHIGNLVHLCFYIYFLQIKHYGWYTLDIVFAGSIGAGQSVFQPPSSPLADGREQQCPIWDSSSRSHIVDYMILQNVFVSNCLMYLSQIAILSLIEENNNVRYEIVAAISRPLDNMIWYPASQHLYLKSIMG